MQRNESHERFSCDVSAFRVGVAAARFNATITAALLRSAEAELKRHRIKPQAITVLRVPGSIEIPLALKLLAETGKYEALLALGAVIRGETPHFDYVCRIASDGVLRVMLDYGVPVGFGILTTHTEEQARARFHAGAQAVRAALHMACLKSRLS